MDILLNPIYVGKIRFNVQQDWNSKRRKGTDPNPIVVDGFYSLTGILKCPVCGAGMVISRAPDGKGGRVVYYSCRN